MTALTKLVSETRFKQTAIGRVPVDWKSDRLGKVCEVVGGGTPSTAIKRYWNGDIPFVTPTDVTDLEDRNLVFLRDSRNHITKQGLDNSSSRLLPIGSVLLTSRATIGYAAINEVVVATNQGFANLICNERVHNIWLLYIMRFLRPRLERLAAGSTFKEVSKGTIRSLNIVLPTYSEQKRIAKLLLTVEETIRNANEIISTIETLKKGLMAKLYSVGIGHKKFKKTEAGMIPVKWRAVRLGNMLSYGPQNGLYKPASFYGSGTQIIRIKSFGFGSFQKELLKRIRVSKQELSTYSLKIGDIVLNRVNSIDFVGKSILIQKLSEPMVFESNMMRFRLDENLADPRFIVAYLNSNSALQHLRTKAKRAVQQASVNQADVKSVPIPLPPMEEQKVVGDILGLVDRRLELERNAKSKLELAKRGLMDLLLTGRVRIIKN
jgi:type I restriction enzyme S subunit